MWDDAWAYDLATSSFTGDLPYWTSLLEDFRPRRALDLACGTGRISLPLAERGLALRPDFELTGIDLSAAFLDRARQRLVTDFPHLSCAVSFATGDISAFELDGSYDFIVLGYNSLAYLTTAEQHQSCFESVRRHLEPGGRFAIDLAVPSLDLLAESQRAVFPMMRNEIEWVNPAPDIARFSSFYKTSRYDAATQTEETTHYWEIYYADGRRQSIVKELTWHQYFPSELRALLRQSGLVPVAEYGSYDRAPFSSTSSNYLWVITSA